MTKEKMNIIMKSAHIKLGLIVFPEDRLAIIELSQQQDYIDNRDKYVYELTLLLMTHGYTNVPDNRSPIAREEVATKLMDELSRMFHHLMNEEGAGVRQTINLTPFPSIRIQINTSDNLAYIALGDLSQYDAAANEASGDFVIIDGDHFLWGLVYNS